MKAREAGGSRAVRRLRRDGLVPGVLYGGEGGPVSFAVDARVLRHALAARGAVLEVVVDGGRPTPAVLKEQQRDPVRGGTVHLDLVRVRLDVAIQVAVPVVLEGGDGAPGVREGGVLELVAHEVQVEALPTAIPESIVHDVSEMAIGDTLTLAALRAPAGVTVVGDPDAVIATLTPPRLRADAETEIETETQVVGEGEAPAADAGGEDGGAGEGGESAE
ncbi:MAG TPA: 50S ribosomal protein L25 [Solirubrobacteraceae bacterium]|nr:50S ribosomal protein L25 [Solirubrobacteraceae bacterium]